MTTDEVLKGLIWNDKNQLIESVLDMGADINCAMFYAIKVKKPDALKILLEHGADVNVESANGLTPLQTASCKGNMEICKILMEAGATVDYESLRRAAWSKDIELCSLYLEHGNISLENTDILTRIYNSNEDIIRFLLKAGASPNVRDKEGRTPLHDAVDNSKIESVKMLLQAGADVNAKDNNGNTPLSIAAEMSCMKLCKLLLEAGATVDESLLQRIKEKMMDKIQESNAYSCTLGWEIQSYADIQKFLKEFSSNNS